MENFILIFKGLIIGIAKIIPGVSGAVLAISLGVYEKVIKIISKPLQIKLKDAKFLMCLAIGIILGIKVMCECVKWCLNSYYLPTMLLFTGFIVGGMSDINLEIKSKITSLKNWIIFGICLTFSFILTLNFSIKIQNSNFIFLIMGCLESFTTIVPGISGTAIFMALNLYQKLLNLFIGFLSFNIPLESLVLFGLGFVLTTILLAKLINFLFSKYKAESYFAITGFMVFSLIMMFKNMLMRNFTFNDWLKGMIFCAIGIYLTKKLNNIFSKLSK